MKKVVSVFVVILTILFVMFIIQNAASVYVDFIFWTLEISFSLLMIVCMAIGFLIGLVVMSTVGGNSSKDEPPSEPKPTKPSKQGGGLE